MNNEQESYPVRYMPVWTWYGCKVIDTMHSEGKTVKRFIDWMSGLCAYKAMCYVKRMNEAEGYVYAP